MKRIILALCILTLCGCSQKNNHTCKMTSNEYDWNVEYETDDAGNVQKLTQSVVVKVSKPEDMETYQKLLDDMFNAYIEEYSGACSLEKADLETMLSRTIIIDYQLLSEKQKEEMSFEKEEKLLIAQLENVGYQCK